jgi:hypothetical protein
VRSHGSTFHTILSLSARDRFGSMNGLKKVRLCRRADQRAPEGIELIAGKRGQVLPDDGIARPPAGANTGNH